MNKEHRDFTSKNDGTVWDNFGGNNDKKRVVIQKEKSKDSINPYPILAWIITFAALLGGLFLCFGIKKLNYSEVGVVYKYATGVSEELLQGPSWYILPLGKIHKITPGSQYISFCGEDLDGVKWRNFEPIGSFSSDGLSVWTYLSVNYHLKKDKLVDGFKKGFKSEQDYLNLIVRHEILVGVKGLAIKKSSQEFVEMEVDIRKKIEYQREIEDLLKLKESEFLCEYVEVDRVLVINVKFSKVYEEELDVLKELKEIRGEAKEEEALAQFEIELIRAENEAMKIEVISSVEKDEEK